MMEQSDKRLAEIAQSCGFADQSHFSRTFRAVMGSSPAAWRRERRSGVTASELGLSAIRPAARRNLAGDSGPSTAPAW